MRYFEGIETLGELKREFRRLALENHPDHGGDGRLMREIICEYQRLVRILPDIGPEPEETREAAPAENAARHEARFHCAFRPTTAGGANPGVARLAKPVFTHRQICLIAKSLFVYARLADSLDLKSFYRKLCSIFDPGQTLPYRDYVLNREIAKKSLKFLRKEIMKRVFSGEILKLARKAESELAKAA